MRQHIQKTQREITEGGYLLLLFSINTLGFFALAACWPQCAFTSRQTSKHVLQEGNISREGGSHSSPPLPCSKGTHLSLSFLFPLVL